jgi:hypothetical protein
MEHHPEPYKISVRLLAKDAKFSYARKKHQSSAKKGTPGTRDLNSSLNKKKFSEKKMYWACKYDF